MKKNRSTLKDYFKKGAIPTEANFADLIDSMLNQDEDNISKLPNDPLKITATGVDEALLNFYRVEKNEEKLSWQVKQKPDGKPGLSISDTAASRFFIENGTGNVGIGTITPKQTLDVRGRMNIEDGVIQKGGDPITGTKDLGLYSPGDGYWIRIVTKNAPIAFFTDGGIGTKKELSVETGLVSITGKLGIGTTTTPTAKLQVSGGDIQLDGSQKIFFSDTDTTNNLKLQLWSGYGLGINGATLFYAANGQHSWRDNNGTNERMLLTTGAEGGLTVKGTGVSSFIGNLGIGTTSIHNPQGWNKVLDILGTSHARLNVRSSGGVVTSIFSHDDWGGPRGVFGTDSNHSLTFATNYTHRMTIDTNGSVGIGTTAPIAKLQVVGGTIMPSAGNSEAAGLLFPPDPSGGGGDRAWLRYYARSGESMTFELGTSNDSDDHIALMPSGNVGIGTNTPAAKLDVVGMIKTQKLRLGDKWTISGVGDVEANDDWLRLHRIQEVNIGGVANYYGGFAAGKMWCIKGNFDGSDLNMKEDIETLDHPIEDLLSLRGVQFKWQNEGENGKYQMGLIAQEVEKVFPELVEVGPNGMKGINYNGLIAPLIEAIKQQQMQIGALRTEIQTLKSI